MPENKMDRIERQPTSRRPRRESADQPKPRERVVGVNPREGKDILTWYLEEAEAIANIAGSDTHKMELSLSVLDETLRSEVNQLPDEEKLEATLVREKVAPLVYYQEVEARKVDTSLEKLVGEGQKGLALSPRDLGQFFYRFESVPEERWKSLKLEGGDGLGDSKIVRNKGKVESLFNEATDQTGVVSRLKAVWNEPDGSPALVKETGGVRKLRGRLKSLEAELAPGGINPSQPEFQVAEILERRVEGGLAKYVQAFIDYREEQNGERSFPESTEENLFLNTVRRVRGGEELEKEYRARKGLHRTDMLFSERLVDNLEGVLKGVEWANAVADMGRILKEHPAAGAFIQQAEIAVKRRRLAYLKIREAETRGFLADPDRIARFREIAPELREMAEIHLNGGSVGEMKIQGIIPEIKELEGKESLYRQIEVDLENNLNGVSPVERKRSKRLADRIRRITGLATRGNYSGTDQDPAARGDRVLSGPMHFLEFINAALGTRPARRDLIQFTPFADLRLGSLWETKVKDFFVSKGISDLALVNFADLDIDKFEEKGKIQALILWARDVDKAYTARSNCNIIIQRSIIGPESFREAKLAAHDGREGIAGKFDYLSDAEQKAYQRWWLELATPGILQSLVNARNEGGNLIGSINAWIREGAMGVSFARYFDACGISKEMQELGVEELSAPEKARLLIHIFYRSGRIEYKKARTVGSSLEKLKDGQLLAAFLRKRFRGNASGDQLVASLMAFAGVREDENGKLVVDDKIRETLNSKTMQIWRNFFSSNEMRIIDYADFNRMIDSVIWDAVNVGDRSDLLACFDEFYAIKRQLRFGMGNAGKRGVRICSSEGDKLMNWSVGDATDQVKYETNRRAPVDMYFDRENMALILRMRMLFSKEWRLRIKDKNPWDLEMTPMDVKSVVNAACQYFRITGEQRRRFERQMGYSRANYWWFRAKRSFFIFGVKDIKGQLPGQQIEDTAKKVVGGSIIGKALDYLPFPKSLVDAGAMGAAGLYFSAALGWAGWPLGIIVGGGIYGFSLGAGIRALVRRPWMPEFIRCWDFKVDPAIVFKEGILSETSRYPER